MKGHMADGEHDQMSHGMEEIARKRMLLRRLQMQMRKQEANREMGEPGQEYSPRANYLGGEFAVQNHSPYEYVNNAKYAQPLLSPRPQIQSLLAGKHIVSNEGGLGNQQRAVSDYLADRKQLNGPPGHYLHRTASGYLSADNVYPRGVDSSTFPNKEQTDLSTLADKHTHKRKHYEVEGDATGEVYKRINNVRDSVLELKRYVDEHKTEFLHYAKDQAENTPPHALEKRSEARLIVLRESLKRLVDMALKPLLEDCGIHPRSDS